MDVSYEQSKYIRKTKGRKIKKQKVYSPKKGRHQNGKFNKYKNIKSKEISNQIALKSDIVEFEINDMNEIKSNDKAIASMFNIDTKSCDIDDGPYIKSKTLLISGFAAYCINNKNMKLPTELTRLIERFCQSTQRVEGEEFAISASYLVSATTFWVHDADNYQLNNIDIEMGKLAEKLLTPPAVIHNSVLYAAKYNGFYARIKVRVRDIRYLSENRWFVEFIDHGNRAIIAQNQFVELCTTLQLDQIPTLARKCTLAGIDAERFFFGEPVHAHGDIVRFGEKNWTFGTAISFCGHYIFQTENEEIRIKILYNDKKNKIWHVELFCGQKSINQLLARNGLAKLGDEWKYNKKWTSQHIEYVDQYFDTINANIKVAKHAHAGIWRHGDIGV